MNKKLLFGIMSLAALTACTSDDFESQEVAQKVSPIQFEVINNAETRASMDGNTIAWNADDNDLFTLYHACALPNAGENAIYRATTVKDKPAVLTTPSMILPGEAIMVWPADTAFTITNGTALSVKIPAMLDNIEKNIPYVSDVINIYPYGSGYGGTHVNGTNPTEPNSINTAGYSRSYPIYMRPMASQLIVKADYAGTDATLATLYSGDDPIKPISVESIDLVSASEPFTTQIALTFSGAGANWGTVPNNAWTKITKFGAASASSTTLTTKVLDGNAGCKFLLLPTTTFTNTADKKVVVNTYYGKVEVSPAVYTTAAEYNDSWYRFISPTTAPDPGETKAAAAEASGENAGKHKTTAKIEDGLLQTITAFNSFTRSDGVAKGEPAGTATTRYVKVLLTKLDMSDLHVKDDKQLRDVVRVWKKMTPTTPVVVYLDGGKEGNPANTFTISQKTIETINNINNGTLNFQVKPCKLAGEACTKIVVTGTDYKQDVQDIAFITNNAGTKVNVELANEAKEWKWNGNVKVQLGGVSQIINKGKMENGATATLKTTENNGTQNNVPLVNDGTWNIGKDVTLRVQFDVTNNGTVNIGKEGELTAQYRQDGATTFTNDAKAKPSRFGGDDSQIGTVWNYGVFATVNGGTINNYGLIEHADNDAKTYISSNDNGGAGFGTAFGPGNKIGRINLPWGNKEEDNLSVNGLLNKGFISVTVDKNKDATVPTGALNAGSLGGKVNYLIIKSGPSSIANVATQVDYLEVEADKELAWSVFGSTQNFVGLMVLSDINIKQNSAVNVTGATYLKKDMYVGGTFATASWNGYYGNTAGNVATNYITY